MNFILILTVSFALSVDAFAMMTANFKAYDRAGVKIKIFAVLLFAFLHALFVFIGKTVAELLFDGVYAFVYVIFIIFLLLSVKCIFSKEEQSLDGKLNVKLCTVQAVVTSLDAFVGGITLINTPAPIFYVLMGVFTITAFMTALGLLVGKILKNKFMGKEKYVSALLFLILAVMSVKDAILG